MVSFAGWRDLGTELSTEEWFSRRFSHMYAFNINMLGLKVPTVFAWFCQQSHSGRVSRRPGGVWMEGCLVLSLAPHGLSRLQLNFSFGKGLCVLGTKCRTWPMVLEVRKVLSVTKKPNFVVLLKKRISTCCN